MGVVKRRTVRLFLARELAPGRLPLGEREAHYLGNVLRLRVGDRLIAFDGRGTERAASVVALSRRGGELELGESLPPLAESPLRLTLLQALVKADAMDWIVQKATELGIHAIAPVITELSVVKLDAERSERRVDHWSRIAQSACEQSGRHVRPQVHAPVPLAERLAALSPAQLRIALVPGGALRSTQLPGHAEEAVLAVGPEGGWGNADLRALEEAGFASVALGTRTLRADTAAVAACALLQERWGDLGAGR